MKTKSPLTASSSENVKYACNSGSTSVFVGGHAACNDLLLQADKPGRLLRRPSSLIVCCDAISCRSDCWSSASAAKLPTHHRFCRCVVRTLWTECPPISSCCLPRILSQSHISAGAITSFANALALRRVFFCEWPAKAYDLFPRSHVWHTRMCGNAPVQIQ